MVIQYTFEARTGEVWPLNVGQVYTTLQRLERDGLVESDDDARRGPQKGFRITADGAAELAEWLRTPPDLSSPPRDELVIKVLVALRVPGVDVHEVIQAHRRYLVELMQQWTRLKEDDAERDLAFALVVDAELFRLDSVVRWLDAADGRLDARPPMATAGARATAPAPTRRRAALRRHDADRATAMSVLRAAAVSQGLRQRRHRGARAARRRPDASTPASWSRSWARAAPARARC